MVWRTVYTADGGCWLRDGEAIQTLRQVWLQHYHAHEQQTPWRTEKELPPSALLIPSPYDVEARYSRKKRTAWNGYKVHFTETCDTDTPHLIVEVTSTSATTADGEIIGALHSHRDEQQLLPDQHLMTQAISMQRP